MAAAGNAGANVVVVISLCPEIAGATEA
jgi:hypothetical protein